MRPDEGSVVLAPQPIQLEDGGLAACAATIAPPVAECSIERRSIQAAEKRTIRMTKEDDEDRRCRTSQVVTPTAILFQGGIYAFG